MNIRRERVERAAAIILPWTALGLFSSIELRLESTFTPRQDSLAHALLLEMSFVLVCAALTPAVLALARRFPLDRRPYWPNALLHLLAAAVFTLIAKSIWYPLMMLFDPKAWSWLRFFWSIVYSFDYCMVLYFVVVLISYALKYYRSYQRGLVDAARLNAELAQAQLRWLKSRLHPHFLFNALNTISALVHEDPRRAETMIARLSDLLRLALRDSAMQEVPLHQELQYLNIYLDIEHTRFEDRLSVEFTIEPGMDDALVPGLLLQPIVENAIRHGLSEQAGKGKIQIAAYREGSRLCLTIADNGKGMREGADRPREGVGLSSVRGRLERLYGSSHSMVLRNQAGGGVEARITIPFITSSGAAGDQEVIHETISHVGS